MATLGEAVWLAVAALPSVIVLLVMRTAQAEQATLPGGGRPNGRGYPIGRDVAAARGPGSTPLGIIVFVLACSPSFKPRCVSVAELGGPEVALVIGAAGLLVAALVLPLNIPGWQFFAPRFLTTGLALSLCLLGG